MKITFVDILFLISIILLAILPLFLRGTKITGKKKLLVQTFFWIFFLFNLVIRVYLINTGHKKSQKIEILEKRNAETLEKMKIIEKQFNEIPENIKPNKITLFSKNIEKTELDYTVLLRFKPLKNAPLGLLIFVARLPVRSNAKILDFWPTTGGGAFQSGKDSKKISEDGYTARLTYSLIGYGYPTVELKVSGSTSVQVEGNYGLEPFVIEIK